MNLEPLTKPAAPFLHLLTEPASPTYDALQALEKQAVSVRFIRGRKSTTTAQLLSEIAAALQFPYYFGDNWDALADCLMDLSWLETTIGTTKGVVLAIYDAAHLLEAASPVDIATFQKVLQRAAAHWSQAKSHTSIRSFHVVFECGPNDKALLIEKWPGLAVLNV